ncbi:MAG TPA: hypothetical protein VNQ81_02535 [Povalibacter sp.]|nr:hypothetical protein [Povalibacter sp.]
MRRFLFLASLALAVLLALLVSAMNSGRVEIELAFGRVVAPLGVGLVVAFTVGLLAGLAWRVYWVAELLSERGRLRRALRQAEAKARAAAADDERNP